MSLSHLNKLERVILNRRVVGRILSFLVLINMVAVAYGLVYVEAEEWVPYVPRSDMVELVFWTENRTVYIDVAVTFPDAGYTVSDWGTPVREGYEIWVDSKILDWTGPAALVITTYRYTYNLGFLEKGNYTFIFKVWGYPIKSIRFVIGLEGDANQDGVVNIFDIATISAHWYPGPPIGPLGYDLTADLNLDGAVNIHDVGIVSANWEQSE